MRISKIIPVFDTADLDAESTFWAGILGGTVEKDEEWASVIVGGERQIDFQLAPDHVPPDWPDGEPQQAHLDVYIDDDIATVHEEAIALGARLLKEHGDETFQVYADPSGHPFCLCWG